MFLFWAPHGWGQKASLLKICHTYPTMMKPGTVVPRLKKYKYINHVTHSLSSVDIDIFSLQISKFCHIKRYSIDCILIHNF